MHAIPVLVDSCMFLLCIFHMSVPSLFLVLPSFFDFCFVSYVVRTYYPFILSGVVIVIISSVLLAFLLTCLRLLHKRMIISLIMLFLADNISRVILNFKFFALLP